ncbi:unnamed protein product, partial [marine sediment metagenome]
GEFGKVEEVKESLDLAYMIKETQNLFKGIVEGSSRSMQIVKDLRTFSRIDEIDGVIQFMCNPCGKLSE